MQIVDVTAGKKVSDDGVVGSSNYSVQIQFELMSW